MWSCHMLEKCIFVFILCVFVFKVVLSFVLGIISSMANEYKKEEKILMSGSVLQENRIE